MRPNFRRWNNIREQWVQGFRPVWIKAQPSHREGLGLKKGEIVDYLFLPFFGTWIRTQSKPSIGVPPSSSRRLPVTYSLT